MKLVTVNDKISIEELKTMSKAMFDELVKAVVDVENGIMVVDAAMHADEEAFLIEKGSKQEDVWGINLWPFVDGEEWIEFDSMINYRASVGNKSRGVDDPALREKIRKIVKQLVTQ